VREFWLFGSSDFTRFSDLELIDLGNGAMVERTPCNFILIFFFIAFPAYDTGWPYSITLQGEASKSALG
jgi:hypothetical protein